jgi:hypothetical protein
VQLEDEVVDSKEVPKKFFIMHKHSKMFNCIDERGNICLFNDEDENRFSPGNTDKILAKDYIKLDITFDEYLELTGLKRKDNLKDCRNELVESFGCQKKILAPVLNKLEELLTEISKAKNQHNAMNKLELLSVYSIREVFGLKYMKLGGGMVLKEVITQDEKKGIELFKGYIELFEKQLTKTAN